MTTSGNGCQGRNHIYITSLIEKLHLKTGDVSSANRMGCTNVKIVLAVVGVNIIAILSTGSVNGMAHVGLIIYLGYDGKQCLVVTDRWNLFEEDEPEDLLEPEDLPFVSGPEFQPKENTMVIVDKSRVHCLEAKDCVHLQTCPQPGINVLLSEDESLDDLHNNTRDPSWKYTRSFGMDGNFKVKHLHPIKPFDEVWLSNGLGFMVGKDRYKMHLAEAADTVEKSSCNNHWAVNQANAAWHKLESTSIGGVACARHSCFVPHPMVDFQKGKRQATSTILHSQVWVDQSQFLEMAPQLTIIPGIGLWHVHGHQDSCYIRYASNFIEGIGWINREIMETLWAQLNLISPAAWGMSSPHQKECLDYQMNDSNFCKMIHMKRTLCWKYKLARNGILESGKAFDRLNEAAPSHLKTECKKEIELRFLEEGNARNAAPSHRSVVTWILTALAIEEAQIALLIKIDGFAQSALTHLGEGFDADDEPEDLDVDILDDLDDDPADFTETSHT
ncbi:hypothetical protein BDR06DRAFT_975581 [Suillus hirtellus]|nr:hypothetical protein BDR06DRAFT_975581 [Suillus hirtellus]